MKTTTLTTLIGLAAVTFVAAPMAEAQVTSQANNTYLLRYKWTKNKSYKYDLTTTMTSAALPNMQPVKDTISLKVTDVQNGIATLTSTVQGQSSTAKVDNRGQVQGGGSNTVQAPTLPAKAIKVGGTWTGSENLPMMAGAKSNTTYTLKGFKTVNGSKKAHISAAIKVTGGGMNGTGNADYLVDMTDGMLYRGTVKMDMSMPNPQGGKAVTMKVAVTMNRS